MVPLLFAAMMRQGYTELFLFQNQYAGADRYFLVPSLFFILSLFLFADYLLSCQFRLFFRILFVDMIAIYTAFLLPLKMMCVEMPRSYDWEADVSVYYQTLLKSDHETSRQVYYDIVIHPGPPWHVRLPHWSLAESERERIQRQLEAMEL